jgi:hypothetical protein
MLTIRYACRDRPTAHGNNKDMSPYASTRFLNTMSLSHVYAKVIVGGIGAVLM